MKKAIFLAILAVLLLAVPVLANDDLDVNIVRAFFFDDVLSPGDYAELYVVPHSVSDEPVRLQIASFDFNYYSVSRSGWGHFHFRVPSEPGFYTVQITAQHEFDRDIKYLSFEVQ